MSCFIVSEDCMQKVINAALLLKMAGKVQTLCNTKIDRQHVSHLWAALYAANQLAFNGRYQGRYQDDAEAPAFAFKHYMDDAALLSMSPGLLIYHAKAVEAFVYQCAEDGVPEAVYDELEAFREAMFEYAGLAWATTGADDLNIKQTPDYQSAPWG